MDLSIVVVSWNTRDLLARCLQSIYATAGDLHFEVFVVDNASTDGSVEMVRQRFSDIRLICNDENVGFARANNQALAVAKGRFVLLLNSDATVLEDTIAEMVAWIGQHSDAGIVGPTLLHPNGTFQASYGRFPTLWSCLLDLAGLARRVYGRYFPSVSPDASQVTQVVDWVGGACMLIRQEALLDVGPFDPEYHMYAEEMDLCYRMRRSGWQVYYHPGATVLHLGGGSSAGLQPWVLARQWRARLRFVRMHYGPVRAWILRGLVLVLGLVRAAASGIAGILSLGRCPQFWARARANLNLMLLQTHEPGPV